MLCFLSLLCIPAPLRFTALLHCVASLCCFTVLLHCVPCTGLLYDIVAVIYWTVLLYCVLVYWGAVGIGLVAEHNHVDYSNNMWRWKFRDNLLEGNRRGGLDIQLPHILNPYRNGNHSVQINTSR